MTDRPVYAAPAHIFVIGTASLDTLHLAAGTAHTIGGAGLYTALAARAAGATAGLFAPVPEPMPPTLQPITERLQWYGPTIAPADLPRLEIAHHGHGQATLLDASWGAEASLTPSQLPAAARDARVIHIAALSTAQRQWDFVQALRCPQGERGRPRLSVGTYARLAYGATARVRTLFEQAEYFFMNANEAVGLFGGVEHAVTQPETWLFVTLGADGVLAITGREVVHIPGHPVTEIDPTGAGDTLCGATLAGIARGLAPITAAEQAVILAARTVGAVGPAALLGEDAPMHYP